MNQIARKRGVVGVKDILARYADGGIVETEEERRKRLGLPPVGVDPAVAAGNSPLGLDGKPLIDTDGTPFAAQGPIPGSAAAPMDPAARAQAIFTERLSRYGQEVGDIVKSAVPEILGVTGAPLDPNWRIYQTGQQAAKAFQDASMSASQTGIDNRSVTQTQGGPGGPGIPNITIVVQSVDEAFRRAQVWQQQQVAAYSRR